MLFIFFILKSVSWRNIITFQNYFLYGWNIWTKYFSKIGVFEQPIKDKWVLRKVWKRKKSFKSLKGYNEMKRNKTKITNNLKKLIEEEK